MFDADVLQYYKKLVNMETHLNLRRSLLKFVKGKGQVQFQDDEMLPEKFMGTTIEQDEIGLKNIMEGRVAGAWCDIQEQHLVKKESHRTTLGWAKGVVVGIL